MTTDQKQRLAAHVAWHKPRRFNGENIYFLTEGEIISFTGCEYTSQNAQYEIDNMSNRKIWFSQLTNFYFSDDFDSIYQPIIKFKDGTSYVISESFDESTFYNKVKNKKFKVDIVTDAPYILNKQSDLWDQKSIYTYKEAYDYIRRCLSLDRIDEIGDLLKTSKAYFLTEI